MAMRYQPRAQSGDIDAAYGMTYEAYQTLKMITSSFHPSRHSVRFCSINMTSPVIRMMP